MVPRYARPEMSAIWSAESRYRIWFEIEAHALDAMAELGIVPPEAAATIWFADENSPPFDIARIDAIQKENRRHRIAFPAHGAQRTGPPARFPPQGMTSSDVLDTCL